MKKRTALTAVLLASSTLAAQTTSHTDTHKKKVVHHKRTARVVKPRREAASEGQVRELREEMQAQIDTLKAQVATKDSQLATAQESAAQAQTSAATAAATATQASTQAAQTSSSVTALQDNVSQLKANTTSLTETVVNNQAAVQQEINEPAKLHYKGVTITPVAFFAFEGVWRQRSVNSDINTPFNTIPFPSANEGHTSELNFSGRQSRLGGLFEGNAGSYKLSGYFEADFLSAGVTSNNNQSNSYTLRQRQIWGQLMTAKGFGVTGGQMWSLVTEDAHGTDNRTEILPNTIDPQYVVGYNWARQPALRLQQHFGPDLKNGVTLALAAEQAQITSFTATSATSGAVPGNFFFAGSGTGGGLYNSTATYANNVAPDVIVKAAFDAPKFHAEVGGLARFFRDRYYPITSATTVTTGATAGATAYTYSPNSLLSTTTGGGVFGTVRVKPTKMVEVGIQGMAGQGVARYGSAQLADATVKPDGELEPIRNYHGLGSVVLHPAPKLDIYAYYGGEYAQRTVYRTTTGALIGYGAPNLNDTGCYALPVNPASSTGGSPSSPSSCASPTRYIQEGVLGLTYRAINSPKYGRLQYQVTYSYLQRNLWSGVGTAFGPTGPRAQDNMVHAGMRYYIP